MAQMLSSRRHWRRELSVLLAQSATPATLSPAPCASCWPNHGHSGVMVKYGLIPCSSSFWDYVTPIALTSDVSACSTLGAGSARPFIHQRQQQELVVNADLNLALRREHQKQLLKVHSKASTLKAQEELIFQLESKAIEGTALLNKHASWPQPSDGKEGGAGESSEKNPKEGSGHCLLHDEPPASDTESSSEEEEEFGVVGNRSRFVKVNCLRCCQICSPLCAFAILAACIGLLRIWMPSRKNLEQWNLLGKYSANKKQLEKIELGELGLKTVWRNIIDMNRQMYLLNSAANPLKVDVKSAADLISLLATVEGLQKSVASIGNTCPSCCGGKTENCGRTQEAMELPQSDMNQHSLAETRGSNQIIPLPSAPSELDNKTHSENLKQDVLYLHNSLEEVNSALGGEQRQNDLKLEGMNEAVSIILPRVNLVERDPVAMGKVEKQATVLQEEGIKREASSDSRLSKLSRKLQLISTLTHKLRATELRDLFHKSGQNEDGKLTSQEIWNSLGSAMPAPESLMLMKMEDNSSQMNNAVPTSPLLQQMGHPHSYPSLGQISNPYEQQPPGKELNKYASLKAVADKANDDFYSKRRHLAELAAKGNLPLHPSRARPRQAERTKSRTNKTSSHPLAYNSNTNFKGWDTGEHSLRRQAYGSKGKLGTAESGSSDPLGTRPQHYPPPQPYFITNSKTEVTV
ncbi:LOW QUALITY PROTEIN: hypothetical protein QTO34_013526 [Cnephaeus nilssonii]|uniref:EF-hand domain-containing protein n=1 Tax=Cnephaeus nilssonii TaxID=3371016 RepID=A0AA40I858_CNENI|nr:LOW QUALITY PROTEIN: hypothetical protein QTO34_013526 [Eptesicus nilssonii]